MGVQGWVWLLQKEGFLPERSWDKQKQCYTSSGSSSLWRDESALRSLNSFAHRLAVIPQGSELHVDGNGLAFALHRVAYARHVAQILEEGDRCNGESNPERKNHGRPASSHQQRQNNNNNNGANIYGNSQTPRSEKKKLSKLSSSQATRLLPNFMPMQRLSDVTREFVRQLQGTHQMELKGSCVINCIDGILVVVLLLVMSSSSPHFSTFLPFDRIVQSIGMETVAQC